MTALLVTPAPASVGPSRTQAIVDSPGESGDAIRKSRFVESQIVAILKEREARLELSELTRKHDSAAPYFQ